MNELEIEKQIPLAIPSPIEVSSLSEYLPHRDSAIWVDKVLWFSGGAGICRAEINKEKPYVTNGIIRPSTYIEWIAQSYGYVSACSYAARKEKRSVASAFLVGVRNLEIFEEKKSAADRDWVRILVKMTHEMGPLQLVEGKIFDSKAKLLCAGQIKLFAQ